MFCFGFIVFVFETVRWSFIAIWDGELSFVSLFFPHVHKMVRAKLYILHTYSYRLLLFIIAISSHFGCDKREEREEREKKKHNRKSIYQDCWLLWTCRQSEKYVKWMEVLAGSRVNGWVEINFMDMAKEWTERNRKKVTSAFAFASQHSSKRVGCCVQLLANIMNVASNIVTTSMANNNDNSAGGGYSYEKRRKIEQHQSTCQMSVTCDPWSNVYSMYVLRCVSLRLSFSVVTCASAGKLNWATTSQLGPTSNGTIDRHTPNA